MRSGKLLFHKTVAAFLVLLQLSAGPAWAAVGCELNSPDRDVPRLFPGAARYKVVTLDIQRVGGQKLLTTIEAKLRDKLRGLYETIDVPYEIYVIYGKDDKKIGYIHGVNQKGRFGGIQIFLVLGLDERIKTLYIQKISGQYGEKLRAPEFTNQFKGLTLADFEQFDPGTGRATGKVAAIKNTAAPEGEHDFRRILRGIKKNFILVNEFLRMAPELSGEK